MKAAAGKKYTAVSRIAIVSYYATVRLMDRPSIWDYLPQPERDRIAPQGEIRNYLRRFGVRKLSDSEALRLACRTIVFNEKLLTTYETMRVDDGRRKRK